jgi:hypothetical protein
LGKITPYTEDELGYILDNMHLPARLVAEHLGRSHAGVENMRKRLKAGWTRRQEHWSEEEDQVIIAGSRRLITAKQLAEKLPGRSADAVQNRRQAIDARVGGTNLSPVGIGKRTLIAKTCKGCGILLPASWFNEHTDGGTKGSCKKCQSTRDTERDRKGGWERASIYNANAQKITLPTATRNGYPYTEADEGVLADTSLSNVAKALKIRRSYLAIKTAVINRGYKSRHPLGNPEDDRWLIDNPNVSRVDEITASLKQEFETAGVPFPAWDWDDEDLKETA